MSMTTIIMVVIVAVLIITSMCISGERDPEEDEEQVKFINEWKQKHEKDA